MSPRKKINRNKKMGNNEENQKDKEHVPEGKEAADETAGIQDLSGHTPAGSDQQTKVKDNEDDQQKETADDSAKVTEQPEQSAEPSPPAAEPSAIDKLKAQSDQLSKESALYKDKWLRSEADMDNYKKRVHKEKLEQLRYGNETLIREILPVIDNLERAVEYSKIHSQKDSLYEGVELTLKMLKKVIDSFGVRTVETVGQMFDPNFHEGLGVEESEGNEDNIIVREVERGYLYNDRLLRSAKVIVGKKAVPVKAGE